MLLNKVKPYTKKIIGDYQASFIYGKSTVDQKHTIKQIAEKKL